MTGVTKIEAEVAARYLPRLKFSPFGRRLRKPEDLRACAFGCVRYLVPLQHGLDPALRGAASLPGFVTRVTVVCDEEHVIPRATVRV